MQKRKWVQILLQVVAWILYFTLPHLMRPYQRPHRENRPDDFHLPPPDSSFWLYFNILQNVLLVPIFYLNVYWVFPNLLRRRRYLLVVLSQLAGFGLHYAFNSLIPFLMLPDGPPHPRMFMALTSYVLILAVSYGVHVYREARRLEGLQKEREMETMKAELQFLRWQVSPHFLFNALNNMVAMARKKSEHLESMLIHLSELMRYMLYETEGNRVNLQKEGDYLQSYIRLQSIRYRDVHLGVHIEIPEQTDLWIEPMLLIPFVENSFKHGIDGVENPVIKVQLHVMGKTLFFEVANKYQPGGHYNKDDAHGVGLANVKRRLELLYADKYSLAVSIDTWYTVHLKIDLA